MIKYINFEYIQDTKKKIKYFHKLQLPVYKLMG